MKNIHHAVLMIAVVSAFTIGPPRTAKGEEQDQHNRKAIEELIGQLVSPNKDPNPERKPDIEYPSDYDKGAQQTVEAARQKLKELGKEAFPILIENMTDPRYSKSITVALLGSYSVGDICFQIIEEQVDLGGMRYKSREDPDGAQHNHEGFFDRYWSADLLKQLKLDEQRISKKRNGSNTKSTLHKYDYLVFRQRGLQKWWDEHRNQSLKEMQIEALKWAIEREQKIGFSRNLEEELYLVPLVKKLDELTK